MRYVDDLGKVKPEEIQHINGDKVLEIRDIENGDVFAVTYENNVFGRPFTRGFVRDGRPWLGTAGPHQKFIYKEG